MREPCLNGVWFQPWNKKAAKRNILFRCCVSWCMRAFSRVCFMNTFAFVVLSGKSCIKNKAEPLGWVVLILQLFNEAFGVTAAQPFKQRRTNRLLLFNWKTHFSLPRRNLGMCCAIINVLRNAIYAAVSSRTAFNKARLKYRGIFCRRQNWMGYTQKTDLPMLHIIIINVCIQPFLPIHFRVPPYPTDWLLLPSFASPTFNHVHTHKSKPSHNTHTHTHSSDNNWHDDSIRMSTEKSSY